MLDLKWVRQNPDAVREALRKRRVDFNLEAFLSLEEKRRSVLMKMEELKAKSNQVSAAVGRLKKAGEDATALMQEMKEVKNQTKVAEEEVRESEGKLQEQLLFIPNIPHDSVPEGDDEKANLEVRRWGEPREFTFEPKAHWDIGENLGILDFERGAKIAGARFTFYRGLGARLERALINFFLDVHTGEHGFEEFFPPFIANSRSMTGTGQLPKFAKDMFRLENSDYFLIPTAEVPLTNYYRDEILDAALLPHYLAAYSACFRGEAGAAGRDTRGIIRQHQFNKVELVKFVKPEDSYAELESLTAAAARILELLELPYRVVTLSSGDLGFSAAKTYDLEVWLPSFKDYREISSCSNFEDFQARRANIRFRREAKAKPEFLHTLNGSGVAVGRTVAAILENYQQANGQVEIPKVLRPYMRGLDHIG